MNKVSWLSAYTLLSVLMLTACGEATLADDPKPPAEPPATVAAPLIERFEATPKTLTDDQATELTWALGGGTLSTLVLTNSVDDSERDVKGRTSLSVSPTETTLYTLKAANAGGEVEQTREVTVERAVVAPPSDDPSPAILVANDDEPEDAEGEEGPDMDIDVLFNDLYPEEGYTFPEITISAQPDAGQVFVDGTDVLYMSGGFVGTTTFEYTLSITDQATGEVLTDSATVTVIVR